MVTAEMPCLGTSVYLFPWEHCTHVWQRELVLQGHPVEDQWLYNYVHTNYCWSHLRLSLIRLISTCVSNWRRAFHYFRIYGNKNAALDTWVNVYCFINVRAIKCSGAEVSFLAHSFSLFELCVACKSFTSVFSSLSSSWGLPGRCRELHCSHSCRSCPDCSHSYRRAGLFHREKEKRGRGLPVLLVNPVSFCSLGYMKGKPMICCPLLILKNMLMTPWSVKCCCWLCS